jgi:MFS family permease
MKSYWAAFRLFDRSILLYLAYWGVISFAYLGVMAVLLNLYLLRLGYGPEFIGLVLGLGHLVWAAFAIPSAAIGARFGTKQAMTAGMLVNAVGAILLVSSELLPSALLSAGLLVSWTICWIGAALGVVNSAPYLMSVTDDKTRGFAFSAQQTVMAATGFAGSMAAGFLPGLLAGPMNLTLDDPAPYRMVLLLPPVAYILGALAFHRARSAAAQVAEPGQVETRSAPVFIFLFIGILVAMQSFSESTVRSFFNVYLDTVLSIPVGQIGGIMGATQLLLVVFSLAVPVVLARFGNLGALTLATLGMSLFIVLISLATTGLWVALAYVGMSIMTMMMVTARGIYSQEIVTPRWRTQISAVATIGMASGWGLAAWGGGALLASIGFQGLFYLGVLVALLSVVLMVARMRVARGRLPEKKEPVVG